MTLKVLIQHPHANNEISGVATYCQQMQRALSRRPNINVRVISTTSTGLRGQWNAVRWADVVHLNSNTVAMTAFSKILRKRLVIKLHYLLYQTVHETYTPKRFRYRVAGEIVHLVRSYRGVHQWKILIEAIARLVLRLCLVASADVILACSRFLAKSTDFKRRVIPIPNPLHIVPLGPNWNSDLNRSHFVFVGRLVDDKGCDLILLAMAALKARGLKASLTVVGEGPARCDLEMQARESGIAEQVSFVGFQTAPEMAAELRRALALVFPARWEEPAGYTPLEAAAQGRVTIAAQKGGLSETCGPHAYYFEAGDHLGLAEQMRSCIQDPEECIERGLRSHEYASRNFDPEASVDQWLEFCL